MRQLVHQMQEWGYTICGVHLMDSLFLDDPAKLIAGVMCSLSVMIQMELPHINVLTKCDLMEDKEALERYVSALVQSAPPVRLFCGC